MGGRQLQALLAHAAATAGAGLGGVDDRELLRRYHRDRDEPAFAELVRRYARLVWATCRQQLRTDADAEDAFQATFLALARNPAAVRDRAGPWLHAVAVRVCGKARLAAARRKTRERVAGRSSGLPVPDSAWDATLAAVHVEAARLPPSLRVPFVLCCLEGKGAAEVAALLGWKPGTLTGRLTRARQTLVARLEARGLSAGAVIAATSAGTSGMPIGLVARTVAITRPGVTVAGPILHLSQGVVGMTAFRLKIAAAFLVAGGLTTTTGSGWLATATAQSADIRKQTAVLAAAGEPVPAEVARPPKWTYDLVRATDVKPAEFVALLQQKEAGGWEYNGEAVIRLDGGPARHWVFRQPVESREVAVLRGQPDAALLRLVLTNDGVAASFRRHQLQAEIKRLQAELDGLPGGTRMEVALAESDLPVAAGDLQALLTPLSRKQFGEKPADWLTVRMNGKGVILSGEAAAVDWAVGVLKKFKEQ